ncbi:hypothetical protein F2P81_006968 [Scophthalmus maximus]|uniref:Uncharacterized protein n=1 Tax=Scophthalmus maximus TaxID=52904 RepID=A0A6A4TB30_SCOMX|nr:hypothetical protein F2P81_006968 [Scophthalmus maximus]
MRSALQMDACPPPPDQHSGRIEIMNIRVFIRAGHPALLYELITVSRGCSPRDAACVQPQRRFLEQHCAAMFTGAAALTLAQPVITGNDEDKVKHVQGENVNVNVYIYIYTILNVPRILPAELSVALLVIHMVPPQEPHRKLISETGQKAMKVEKFPLRPTVIAACLAQKDRYHLPSHDALAQILPGYRYLANDAKTDLEKATNQEQERPAQGAKAAQAKKTDINSTYQVHHPHKRPLLHDFERDPIVAEITDLQTKEVENYRSAMSKMAEDIIALRTQVVTLEAENSQLRSDLSLHQDLGRDLLDDADIAVMTKVEIADRIGKGTKFKFHPKENPIDFKGIIEKRFLVYATVYDLSCCSFEASLKFKLASETSKAASQRDRIQQLQNELIKKNDREKELLKLTRVHQQQPEDLQHHRSHVAKMATLEATVEQQEKVIEKMERAIESKLREKNKQSGDKSVALKKHRGQTDCREIELTLVAENSRLREELDRIRRQTYPVIAQEPAQVHPHIQARIQTQWNESMRSVNLSSE